MDRVFQYASSKASVPSDQLKLIFCLLISYPLGSLFVRIPRNSTALKHLFNIGVSIFFLLGVFHLRGGVGHLLASSIFTYVVAAVIKDKRMPWIVFMVVMGHLTINHIVRAYYNIGNDTIEITGAQMVLTMKLTTFAWNVWDGRQDVTTLDNSQVTTRVTEFPSPLAFLGYVFYFPGILVGPTVDYAAYSALIAETLWETPSPTSSPRNPSSKKRVPEGRKRVAYLKLASGLFFLGLYAFWGGNWDYDVVLTDWWRMNSLVLRLALVQLIGFAQRTKYYAVWHLTEGASILTGLGFNGFTPSGKTRWDRSANVDIPNIEFAPNFKVLLDSWNINTNVWLRNCVYKRVTPKGKKPGFRSSMITFLTSAFWHGIYPGYYLSFLLGGFVQTLARMARTYFRPFTLPPVATPGILSTIIKAVYDVLGIILSVSLLNYMVSAFQLLGLRRSVLGWHRMDWYGHIVVGVGFAFFAGGGKQLCTRMLKDKGVFVGSKEKKEKASNPGIVVSPATPPELGNGKVSWPPVVPPVEQVVVEVKAALPN